MSKRLLRPTVSVAFVLSGFAGLVYEIVWSRYLTLFLGGTAVAHTIVLATFMGGIALGNALFGRLADRPGTNRLRTYALLELGVGLFCLLFPTTFGWLSEIYVALGTRTGPASPFNPVLKATLSAASLFIPCTLMGGTLPVLAKYVVESVAGFGRRLGWLYFVNTAGAVVGCLLGGFYIVERWGLEQGMVATSLINLGIAASFYLLSGRAELIGSDGGSPVPEGATDHVAAEEAYSVGQARLAFYGIGLAGALSMLYELVWFRLLVLSIGGTVHAFSTMLAGFIAGIAGGSYLAGRLLRERRNALALLGLCELGIALLTLLPFSWLERLPFVYYRIGSSFEHTPENYPLFLASSVGFAMLLMGPPALLMGAALPLAGRVCLKGLDRLGRSVGDVFSANTIGNVVGSLLTGLVLLRTAGLEGTLLVGACGSGLLGVLLLRGWRPAGPVRVISALRDAVRIAPAPGGPQLWPAAALGLALLAAWRLASFPSWNPLMLQAGFYRWEVRIDPEAMRSFRAAEQLSSAGGAVLMAKDGLDASFLVQEIRTPETSGSPFGALGRFVRVNGKPDAGTGRDLATQLFVAHLALFFHPQPRTAMVVGLGSGATAGAALRHASVARVDVAEISPLMVEAARYFTSVNDGVLSNPRMSLSILDGRELLLLTRERYDVIISEPTNVWVPGVASLFTEDFYRLVRSRLRPGGVFSQWLPLYSMDRQIVTATLASLSRVFGYVSLWTITDADLLFLAAADPPSFDPGRFKSRFEAVRPLRGITGEAPSLALLADPVRFLSNQVATDESRRLFERRMPAAPYHDLFPRMEFAAARAQFVGRPDVLLAELDERKWPTGSEALYLARYLDRYPMRAEEGERLRACFEALSGPYSRLARSIALETAEQTASQWSGLPDELAGSVLLVGELGRLLDAGRPAADDCERYLKTEVRLMTEAGSVFGRRSPAMLQRRLAACVAEHPRRATEFRELALAALAADDESEAALQQFRAFAGDGTLSRLEPRQRATLLVQAAKLCIRLGRRDEARQQLVAALSEDPTYSEAAQLLTAVATPPGQSPASVRSGS